MQVFVVHGGTAFSTYEEFLHYLQTKEIDVEKLKIRGWKDTLSERLGPGYEVLAPRMPNMQNAKYNEWKIWFERFTPFIKDGVVFVGHSLGAVFLAKYLSEFSFPKRIAATFLVAPPYDFDEGAPLPEFAIQKSLDKLALQGGKIYLYHSKDDQIVPFSEFEKYKKWLLNAHTTVFEDRGHFLQEEFPELVADIKKLHG